MHGSLRTSFTSGCFMSEVDPRTLKTKDRPLAGARDTKTSVHPCMVPRAAAKRPIRRAILAVVLACCCGALALFAGCHTTRPASSDELIVSAAASLRDAFTEIARLHEQRTGTRTRLNFGGSGVLQKQIESGAPADVFASAGAKQMDELANRNLIIGSSRRDFARNVLVLIQPVNGVMISAFTDLGQPEIKKIAVGNPKTVPAGQYTEQTFTKLKLLPGIQSKLIYAEDVRQVLDYVTR